MAGWGIIVWKIYQEWFFIWIGWNVLLGWYYSHKVKNHGGRFMVGFVVTGPIRILRLLEAKDPLSWVQEEFEPLGQSISLLHWGFSLYPISTLSFSFCFNGCFQVSCLASSSVGGFMLVSRFRGCDLLLLAISVSCALVVGDWNFQEKYIIELISGWCH
jgi:hypothetical protein